MKKRTLISTITLAVVAAAALTGCSTAQDDKKASPSPSASATTKPIETVYDKCVDGAATLLTTNTGAGKTFSLGDCANVSIVGAGAKGSSFELGTVETLVVEGDSVTVSVASAKKIIVAGQQNDVTYGGQAEVVDDGAKNTITAQ